MCLLHGAQAARCILIGCQNLLGICANGCKGALYHRHVTVASGGGA